MRATRVASTLLVSVLILIAPLLCVRICEVRAAVAAQTPITREEMALRHAPGHLHTSRTQNNAPHAPLSELQKLVKAITEYLPAKFSYVAPVIVMLLIAASFGWLYRTPAKVITPPPRLASLFPSV
jgi:hypothetical protein